MKYSLMGAASLLLLTTEALSQNLQEIIVTAQRREASLAQTPVAVAVVGADELIKQAVLSEQDLRSATPGLTVRASSNSNQLNYAIRGQSLDAFSDTRPGVLPYFNDVQISGDGGSSAFYDLQSVQVLKGPQGTLFGRSATGGAVLFTTQKPMNDFGGYVSVAGGNYGLTRFAGALNAPIAKDQLLARLAGFYQTCAGYQYNLFSKGGTGGFDRYGARGSLSWIIGERFKNELVFDYAHFNGGSTVGVLWNLKPDASTPAASTVIYSPALDVIFSNPGAFAAVRAAHPGVSPSGLAGDLLAQQARGPFVVNFDGANTYRSNRRVASNLTTFAISDAAQIRNTLGIANMRSENVSDIDSTLYLIDGNDESSSTEQFSEELQLIGATESHKLSYVVGGYFSREVSSLLSVAELLGIEPFVPASRQTNNYSKKNTTYATYAQATYDLSAATGLEGLGFTLGARFTSERTSLSILPADVSYGLATTGLQNAIGIVILPASAFDNTQSKTNENVSWTAGLQEQVNTTLLIYAAARRGYRNGGYNGLVSPVIGLSTSGGSGFTTESLTDAELGLKFQGYVGDLPARLNFAGYMNWIEDAQHAAFTFVRGNPAVITVNVPKARVSGFELDGSINLATGFSVGATLNYAEAKFTDDLVLAQGIATTFGPYPDTPKSSGSVFGEVTVTVRNNLALALRGDFYAQQSTVFSSTQSNNKGARLPGYGLVNFRFRLEDSKAGWSLMVNLKNALDKIYYVGGVAPGEVLQFNTAIPGAPRTVSVEGSYRF